MQEYSVHKQSMGSPQTDKICSTRGLIRQSPRGLLSSSLELQ